MRASYAKPESYSIFSAVSFQSQRVSFKLLLTPHTQLLALKAWKESEEDTRRDHSISETMQKTTQPPPSPRRATQKEPGDSPNKHLRLRTAASVPALEWVYEKSFTRVGKLLGFSQCQFSPCKAGVTLKNWCQSLPLKLSEKKSTGKGSALRKP